MALGRQGARQGKPGRVQHKRYRTMVRAIGRVSTRFDKDEEQLDRRRSRGVRNSCVRESKGQIRRFPRGKLISDHNLFSFYEGQQEAASGQDPRGVFLGIPRPLGGWILVRAPASPAA